MSAPMVSPVSAATLPILDATRRAWIRHETSRDRLNAIVRALTESGRYAAAAVCVVSGDVGAPLRPVASAGDTAPGASRLADTVVAAGGPVVDGAALAIPVRAEAGIVAVLEVRAATGAPDADDHALLAEVAADMARLPNLAQPALHPLSERLLNVAIDDVSEGIYLMEGQSPAFRWVNQSAADTLGYSREQLVGGMTLLDIDDDWRELQAAKRQPEYRDARRLRIETTHRTHDGRRIPVEVTCNQFDADGRRWNLAVVRDVSARKAVEAALHDRERRYRALADHSPDIIVRVDPAGRYLFGNRTFERLAGMSMERLVGHPAGAWLTAGDRASGPYPQLLELVQQVCVSRRPAETEVWLPLPQEPRLYDVRLVPEPDDSDRVVSVLLVARDITDQHRTIAALRASEQRFRQVTENIDEIFWLRDAGSGELIYISPAARRFCPDADRLLRHPGDWLAAVHPDDRQRVRAAYEASIDGYDIEYRCRPRPEDDPRWVHDRAFPVRDDDGRVRWIAGLLKDVTVRRQLEAQLRQSQKLEAVGQLAGGVAHDFNNLLAVIQMQASVLVDDYSDPGAFDAGIREILAATERATNLTRQLLTFSRRQIVQPQDLDIADVIGTMTKLLRRILGEDVTLDTQFAPALPLVHADPGMMEQVIMNLAVNARDAMPAGGTLRVSLDAVAVDDVLAAAHPGVTAGAFIRLTVSDTGAGMSPDILAHVFEPFFTTKEVGKGTGLGLATVFGIVQQHRGWIDVDSAAGEGTSFRVFLPALAETAAPRTPDSQVLSAPRGHETLLFVEDEPAVRSVMRATLERLGYHVLAVDSAIAALELWKTARPRIQMLVTDVILPGGVSGKQLADRLAAEQPGLPVIFTTGYGAELVGASVEQAPGRLLLQKPFTASALARAVRRVLDDSALLAD